MGLTAPGPAATTSAEPHGLDDRGYILAVLLISIAISAVWLGASLPAWRQQAQRERELELIFRGQQYARAIALYYAKNKALPTDIDTLVTEHYLRKKWKDPITNDDFNFLYAGQPLPTAASQTSGSTAGANGFQSANFTSPGQAV